MTPQRFQLARHRAWLLLVSSGVLTAVGLSYIWTPIDTFGIGGWPLWVRAFFFGTAALGTAVAARNAFAMLRGDPTVVILTADALEFRFGGRAGSIRWTDIERIGGSRGVARIYISGRRRATRLEVGLCEPDLSVRDIQDWARHHASAS